MINTILNSEPRTRNHGIWSTYNPLKLQDGFDRVGGPSSGESERWMPWESMLSSAYLYRLQCRKSIRRFHRRTCSVGLVLPYRLRWCSFQYLACRKAKDENQCHQAIAVWLGVIQTIYMYLQAELRSALWGRLHNWLYPVGGEGYHTVHL